MADMMVSGITINLLVSR